MCCFNAVVLKLFRFTAHKQFITFFAAHLIDLKQKTSLNELRFVSYKFLLLIFFLAENLYLQSYKDENEKIV